MVSYWSILKRTLIVVAAIVATAIILIVIAAIYVDIIEPRQMFNVAATHLNEKYGFEKKELTRVDSHTGGSSSRAIVELSDGTRIRVLERQDYDTRTKTFTSFYIDDYQLMDECVLGAEYFSNVFGLDIGFVEYHYGGQYRGNVNQMTLSEFSSKMSLRGKDLDGYMTDENIEKYLYEYMNISESTGINFITNPGITIYVRVDFESDDLDVIFVNAYETYLASPLAETNAEIIMIVHDIELDIRSTSTSDDSGMWNYYVTSKGFNDEFENASLRGLYFTWFRHPFKHCEAYAFKLHDSDKTGYVSDILANEITPYGIWKSEVPKIMLYFDEDHEIEGFSNHYKGSYVIDGEEIKILALPTGTYSAFSIHHISVLPERYDETSWYDDRRYFFGTFETKDNKLFYYPKKDERVESIAELLGIAKPKIPYNIIAVGVPDESPERRGFYDDAKVRYIR